ncbi:hypothetical protein NLU13_8432 [Sarocladium strictum]|uniref:RNA polymerase II-associated protein RBA50 n=1 Tax=Sarocladium strictum TaxID=5046 RepID=A0AA39GBP7_SARSR|nr:hypothetical protein NLU13_8432 [Sarocladium strictum]
MDPTLLIGDIVERDDKEIKKPVDFSDEPFTATPTGFPKHRRRWRPTKKPEAGATSSPGNELEKPASFDEVEKQRIDAENRQRINDMSPEEIAQAQEDIMKGLNPALIQRLLRRANIDQEPLNDAPKRGNEKTPSGSEPSEKLKEKEKEKVTEKKQAAATRTPNPRSKPIDDLPPPRIPPDLFPITDQPERTHFPVPPALPDLDPSDPNFLETLHKKYFPDLPADPSKMAWMAPVPTPDSVADKESPYYPGDDLAVSALRFDFLGRFLSPRVSRKIASTKGLHHHGLAPEAAGYTVAELAHLARSAVPAQRCMAFQTLGRILFRLGNGDWGKTKDDPIAMGVWSAVKEGRVLDSLTEAAMEEGGHRGSRAYATEALWLFEKGGWREQHQGR